MARVIKKGKVPQPRRGPRPKYPWDQWLDGRIWELQADKDFTCSIPSMTDNVRKAARKKGVDVRVISTADTVIIEPVE